MMQTFLPYSDFANSARSLDRQRLGKQRAECLQLLTALETGEPRNRRNHPACKMWAGYELALLDYTLAVCDEWTDRGYRDTCADKAIAIMCRIDSGLYAEFAAGCAYPEPDWLGLPAFHRSHQSNLIRKDADHYRPLFGEGVPDDLPYVWPSEWSENAVQRS